MIMVDRIGKFLKRAVLAKLFGRPLLNLCLQLCHHFKIRFGFPRKCFLSDRKSHLNQSDHFLSKMGAALSRHL